MSRSFFSASTRDRDIERYKEGEEDDQPLIRENRNENSLSLRTLSPSISSSSPPLRSRSQSKDVSRSPPPSFYRDNFRGATGSGRGGFRDHESAGSAGSE